MLEENDQHAVIRGLREGRRDAWAKLYDAYSVELWRYVARLLGPNAAAVGDVIQEAFLEAARTACRFDPARGTLWGWLTGIAHHRVASYWKQANRIAALRKRIEAQATAVAHLQDDGMRAENQFAQTELADLVRNILANLPPDYSTLLTAKYVDQTSLADLSRRSGVTVDAVKSKLARARREFKTKFEYLTRSTSDLTLD